VPFDLKHHTHAAVKVKYDVFSAFDMLNLMVYTPHSVNFNYGSRNLCGVQLRTARDEALGNTS
jgi:hypothetical protein